MLFEFQRLIRALRPALGFKIVMPRITDVACGADVLEAET